MQYFSENVAMTMVECWLGWCKRNLGSEKKNKKKKSFYECRRSR